LILTTVSFSDPAIRAAAESEANRALELDPDSSDAHFALARLAYRDGRWWDGFQHNRQALHSEPANAFARAYYGAMLAAMGELEQAEQEITTAWTADPLNGGIWRLRGRMLDAVGRYGEGGKVLEQALEMPPDAGTAPRHALWFHALLRHDVPAMRAAIAALPEKDSDRAAYAAYVDALADASRWPTVLALIEASERKSGTPNLVRFDLPNHDAKSILALMDDCLHRGTPPVFIFLWLPEHQWLRRDPAFQDFLTRTHILDYWREHGFPPQCRPEGDGARCD